MQLAQVSPSVFRHCWLDYVAGINRHQNDPELCQVGY